jgi:hypothetical protein
MFIWNKRDENNVVTTVKKQARAYVRDCSNMHHLHYYEMRSHFPWIDLVGPFMNNQSLHIKTNTRLEWYSLAHSHL